MNPESHILLIAGDADDAELFSIALQDINPSLKLQVEQNCRVLPEDVIQAEKLPEIIFIDIFVPGEEGIDCMKRLKISPRLKDIPVCMYSGSNNPDYAGRCKDAGASYLLTLPIKIESLTHALNYILGVAIADSANLTGILQVF